MDGEKKTLTIEFAYFEIKVSRIVGVAKCVYLLSSEMVIVTNKNPSR